MRSRIADDGDLLTVAAKVWKIRHQDEVIDETWWQIVDTVVTEVLENMHCFRSAGTTHAADDHKFGHVSQFSHS